MTLTQAFPQPTEPAIASFNFSDIAAGTGYETLFAMELEDDTQVLTPTVIEAKLGFTELVLTSNVELNFDLLYNLPRKVKGNLLVTVTYDADAGSGSATTSVKVRPIHVTSGGIETEMSAAVTTATVVNSNRQGKTTTIPFADLNQHFRKGDKLRIEVTLIAVQGGSGSSSRVYHNPNNVDYGIVLETKNNQKGRSDLIVNIPYDIDL